MKAKDTLLLNNIITQNPILARRAWFWHVASHLCMTILINLVYYYLLANMLDHKFLTCAKAEIEESTVCIVVNGEKFQSRAVTLTLIEKCPISNLSELFSYTTLC